MANAAAKPILFSRGFSSALTEPNRKLVTNAKIGAINVGAVFQTSLASLPNLGVFRTNTTKKITQAANQSAAKLALAILIVIMSP